MISDEVVNAIIFLHIGHGMSSVGEDAEAQLASSILACWDGRVNNSSEDESDDDHNNGVLSTQNATSIDSRNGTPWTTSKPSLTGRIAAHNRFTATPGVPRSVSSTGANLYDSWKMFIHQSV